MSTSQPTYSRLPQHVAIIMDGNGRWATRRNLPRNAGHKKGAEVFEKTVKHALDIGIKYLSAFAFSTENFSRPQEEVDGIMDLMRSYLKDRRKNDNKRVRTTFIGRREELAPDIVQSIKELEDDSRNNVGMRLNIAFNYGSKLEILEAAKQLARDYQSGRLDKLALETLTEHEFDDYFYTAGQPPVDLLIRTSGELRMSNFLLWQSAYSEFVFPDTLFPDFTPKHFDQALEEYALRDRRIGGLAAKE